MNILCAKRIKICTNDICKLKIGGTNDMRKKITAILISCVAGFAMMQSNQMISQPKHVQAAKTVKAKSVSLNKTVYTIKKGKKIKLKATVSPKKSTQKKIIWTSSNKKTATVTQKGTITAKKNGTAIITAKVKGTNKKAKCKIIVGVPVTSIKLSSTSIMLTEGNSTTLKKTISPSNASVKTVTYASSNKNIVQVNQSGKLTAKKEGVAKITVKTKDGTGKKAVCTVQVKRKITTETDKWNYTLDKSNKIIILKKYVGSDKNVTVYNSYQIDGVEYKTRVGEGLFCMSPYHRNDVKEGEKSTIENITFEKNIILPTSMKYMFIEQYNLKTVNMSNLDTSSVTDMSFMFDDCFALQSISFEGLNLSKVKNMSAIFEGCRSLKSIDFTGVNTKSLTDMSFMFSDCRNLKEIDMTSFNTDKVTAMYYMFQYCMSLKNIKLQSFNTSNVTEMQCMFSTCRNLEELDLSNFNIEKVKDIKWMFYGCMNLKNIYVNSSWNTDHIGNYEKIGVFEDCGVDHVTVKK